MSFDVLDDGDVTRTITEISALDDTMLRDISEVWVRDSNNVPRLVFSLSPALSLACDPAIVGGVAYGSGVVTTTGSLATPTGGTGPYTYAWTTISHSNATPPNINSPTSDLSDFTQVDVVANDEAVFRCTVTDSLGATAYAGVGAYFENDIP